MPLHPGRCDIHISAVSITMVLVRQICINLLDTNSKSTSLQWLFLTLRPHALRTFAKRLQHTRRDCNHATMCTHQPSNKRAQHKCFVIQRRQNSFAQMSSCLSCCQALSLYNWAHPCVSKVVLTDLVEN